eukprot:gene14214-biopygen5098
MTAVWGRGGGWRGVRRGYAQPPHRGARRRERGVPPRVRLARRRRRRVPGPGRGRGGGRRGVRRGRGQQPHRGARRERGVPPRVRLARRRRRRVPGVTGQWCGRGAGYRPFVGLGGAGVARAWRGLRIPSKTGDRYHQRPPGDRAMSTVSFYGNPYHILVRVWSCCHRIYCCIDNGVFSGQGSKPASRVTGLSGVPEWSGATREQRASRPRNSNSDSSAAVLA